MLDTEGEGPSEPLMLNEIELVFKPHPTEMAGDNSLIKALKENSIRYIKTPAHATGKRQLIFDEDTRYPTRIVDYKLAILFYFIFLNLCLVFLTPEISNHLQVIMAFLCNPQSIISASTWQ